MSKKVYFDFGYLIILASTFGAVLVLGAVVAPVIFNANDFCINAMLTHYNEGIIMGEIFHRFSYWLNFVVLYTIIYESAIYKTGARDAFAFGATVTLIFSALMFSMVYAPKILAIQKLGVEATQSDTFNNIHIASELDFKLLAVALLALFVRRLMLLRIQTKR